MDYSNIIVSNQKEEPISRQRGKQGNFYFSLNVWSSLIPDCISNFHIVCSCKNKAGLKVINFFHAQQVKPQTNKQKSTEHEIYPANKC